MVEHENERKYEQKKSLQNTKKNWTKSSKKDQNRKKGTKNIKKKYQIKCILRIQKMIKKRRYFFKLGYKRIGDVSKRGKKIQLLNFSRVYSVSTWKLCVYIFL